MQLLPTPTVSEANGIGHSADGGINLRHTVSLLPTPVAADGERQSPTYSRGNPTLAGSLLLTPRAARGASGTETMYELGARRSDETRPQGEALLPTPRASDTGTPGRRASEGFRPPLSQVVLPLLLPTPTATPYDNNQSQSAGAAVRPSLDSLAPKLMPTPRASDGAKGGPNQRGSKGDLTLPSAAASLLPTPTAADSRNSRNATANRTAVKPTTCATSLTLCDATTLLHGAPTPPPSAAGSTSSDGQLPGQLTIEDA